MAIFVLILACGTPATPRERCLQWEDAAACEVAARQAATPDEREWLNGFGCTFGSTVCCVEVAHTVRVADLGRGQEDMVETAQLRAACEADLPAGCRELGFRLSGQAARDAFGKACKLGDSEACAVLADAPPLSP